MMPRRRAYVPGGMGFPGYNVSAGVSGPFGGHATLTDGLVLACEMLEASGTRVDSQGSNDLTDNNTVGSATGLVYANAALFVAANSEYLSITDNADVSNDGNGEFFIEAWIYSTSAAGFRAIFAKDNLGAQREYEIYLEAPANNMVAWIWDTAGTGTTWAPTAAVTQNAWHQIIFGWRSSDSKCYSYYDGGAIVLSAATANPPKDGTAPFLVGARSPDIYFEGRIGPVRRWKGREITDGEVADLYKGGEGLVY